ncbi:MAG TPA: hypothetical protein VD704_08495 [Gaiellaceae bacterium]|nr:hypothetical protein [Gaiellaceae bacterium]
MRHQAATVHELARVAELAVLPGETLTKLAQALERHELSAGAELDAGDRFAVVLSGLVNGPAGVLRPGDRASGALRALTPAAVATCDAAVYETIAGQAK